MLQRIIALCVAALAAMATPALAQVTGDSPLLPPPNGPRITGPGQHIIIANHVHTEPGTPPIRAAIIIENGLIARVIPDPQQRDWPAARVFDMGDAHIYAGFIDAHQPADAPRPDAKSPGAHWSNMVMPQRRAIDGSLLSDSDRSKLHALGFTAAAVAPRTGIFAGRSAVVSLAPVPADSSAQQPVIYKADAYHTMSLESAGWGSRSYPTSQMGAISLIRQTFIDADWLAANQGSREVAGCLADLNTFDALPLVFRTQDELEVLRAAKIADEFERPLMVVGTGTEFRRLDAIAKLADRDGFALIVPLTLPRDPDVSTVGNADEVSLRELLTWEQAPTNARRLHAAGVAVALTSSGLRNDENFSRNLTRALEVGLSGDDALAMLTTHPAKFLGISDDLGTIADGKRAHLVIASGDLFDVQARADTRNAPKILDLWIDGQRFVISEPKAPSLDGNWSFKLRGSETMTLEIKGNSITSRETNDDGSTTITKARGVKIGTDGSLTFLHDSTKDAGAFVLTGSLNLDGSIIGTGVHPSGSTFNWTASRTEDQPAAETDPAAALIGKWHALLSKQFRLDLDISRTKDTWAVTVSQSIDCGTAIEQRAESITLKDDGSLDFAFEHELFGDPGIFTMNARLDGRQLSGTGATATGRAFEWTATRAPTDGMPPEELPGYPFGAYASTELPAQGQILFRGATIWTMSDAGIIEDGDLLIEDGKIAYVGPSTNWAWAAEDEPRIISARRMVITPGIVDAHSHTGISRGVNESGQAVTAEVRISDVTDPDHIDWYRQLAGGVTVVNSMHGSANPIGGQTQTIKVRWGVQHPDDMHMEDAKPGIKFALGENVKQSNWGSEFNTRYPQTRMGVETIMRDRFNAAREYAAQRATERRSDEATRGGVPIERENLPRPDRVAEIDGTRQNDLQRHGASTRERAVRADLANAQSGSVDSFEHSRGTRTTDQARLSANASDSTRIADGIEHAVRTGNHAESDSDQQGNRATSRRDRPDLAGVDTSTGSQGHLTNSSGSLTSSTPPSLRRFVASSPTRLRRDLELDALAEILAGDRLIHCHSYRQDEILMLCHIASDYNIKIGTFQHGLEVYKVAEHVKKHSIGASIFSDWWAFKVEVQDAIPHAGPLQAEVGVLTSYNSDSNELARRMAAEAAKAYKYAEGRLTREESFAFVTINPAIQLGISDRVGSLEVGKDADLAIWNGDPTSTFTRCIGTWIDGREYYSRQRDAQLQQQNAAHRTRVIQKLLGKPKEDPKTEKAPDPDPEPVPPEWLTAGISPHDLAHREHEADQLRDATLDMIRLGKDPAGHQCGDCGTSHIHLANIHGDNH